MREVAVGVYRQMGRLNCRSCPSVTPKKKGLKPEGLKPLYLLVGAIGFEPTTL